ncbi:hypothetical protein G7070_09905 [Propioniciclava coleopterorum]|uniref:histidine kinase n=1 Tax=Propioniciclava coleopterorum TaxID=2714937 RepID=A0A6G7Y770_9ACTN|nr:histidine kinase [Propioniciclava coleopterorum]QIK72526.1 hypothetical protein G7070_09905 [Propioniciclava coleopterorum]
MTPDVAASRRFGRLAAATLGVACASALLGALYLLDGGRPWWHAAALAALAPATALVATRWWRTRGSRPGRGWAVALCALGLAVWGVSGNVSGVPLAALALCGLVWEFGRWTAVAVGAAVVAAVATSYAIWPPRGGAVENLAMVGVLVALGILASEAIAQLDLARALSEREAAARRDEALAELDRALARERMEQARALHDELGQRLTIVGMGLDVALRLRPDPGAAWAEVERARAEAGDALASLRLLVRSLSPLTAEEATTIDLDAALARLAGAFAGTGLAVDLVRADTGETARLDPLAYRIIQEGLTNVARHSDATSVTVTLDGGDERRVRIADDGGPTGRLEPGFGLRHLRARVEAAGGTLRAAPEASGFVLDARYPSGLAA